MAKKGLIARMAWNILRLALLWTRKGWGFKRRLMVELRVRVVPKILKGIGHNTTPRGQLSYYNRERELSFDETPIFHVKMYKPTSMRFNIPCMTAPQVDFDYDFDGVSEDRERGYDECGRTCFLMGVDDEEGFCEERRITDEEDGIDLKAEEFIAKFYKQMRLQRQVSYLQYCEKINKGTT